MTANSSGLLSRLVAIESSCRSFLNSIKSGLGSSSDVDWAIDKLNVHISKKLLSAINVYAYSGDRIFLHLKISIDWNKHQLAIHEGDEYLFVGDSLVPNDIQRITEKALTTFLRSASSAMKVTKIGITYDRSKIADDALGSGEVDRLAGWVNSTPQDRAQQASFQPIRESLQIIPRSLIEMGIFAAAGMSAPRF